MLLRMLQVGNSTSLTTNCETLSSAGSYQVRATHDTTTGGRSGLVILTLVKHTQKRERFAVKSGPLTPTPNGLKYVVCFVNFVN